MKSARLFNGKNLGMQSLADNYIMIDLKELQPDPIDTILELEVVK